MFKIMSKEECLNNFQGGDKPSSDVPKLVVEYGNLVEILGKPFQIFSKYVKVFDLYFVATASSSNDKLLHGASVLYQYIDNDGDGIPDNKLTYSHLVENKATMIMFRNQKELEKNMKYVDEMRDRDDIIVQDLEANETRPGSLAPYEFDEALEECFHLVTMGHVLAYPHIFGLKHGSLISLMMDAARGGYFKKVPKKYPKGAWFTYYDKTCDYDSMIMEYVYWAMTTILGAQQYRRREIKHEWRPCTVDDIMITDYPVYDLLTDPMYKLPSKLPMPAAGISLQDHNANLSNEPKESNNLCCKCCNFDFGKLKKCFKKFRF